MRKVTRGMSNPQRTIFLSLFAAWIVGFARTDRTAGVVTNAGNQFRRTAGLGVAGVMLGFLAGPAPKIASGLAMVMAFTIIAGNADGIEQTARRITEGNR